MPHGIFEDAHGIFEGQIPTDDPGKDVAERALQAVFARLPP
jgi:hypothetical protein